LGNQLESSYHHHRVSGKSKSDEKTSCSERSFRSDAAFQLLRQTKDDPTKQVVPDGILEVDFIVIQNVYFNPSWIWRMGEANVLIWPKPT